MSYVSRGGGESAVPRGGEQGPSHQSVWKLDTTDERGCSFLCPQVQYTNFFLHIPVPVPFKLDDCSYLTLSFDRVYDFF